MSSFFNVFSYSFLHYFLSQFHQMSTQYRDKVVIDHVDTMRPVDIVVEWPLRDFCEYKGVMRTKRINVTGRVLRTYWRCSKRRIVKFQDFSSLTSTITKNASDIARTKTEMMW